MSTITSTPLPDVCSWKTHTGTFSIHRLRLNLAQHISALRLYQDCVCVVFFSVIKGLVGSIVENQLHSLWGPCSPQYSQTQGTGQLTDCNSNLEKENKKKKRTVNLAEGNPAVIKRKEKSTPPLAPWTSMVSPGLIWALEQNTQHTTPITFFSKEFLKFDLDDWEHWEHLQHTHTQTQGSSYCAAWSILNGCLLLNHSSVGGEVRDADGGTLGEV